MKLINADALKNRILSKTPIGVVGEVTLKECAAEIERFPAADAIPVEWIIKQIQEQSLGESKAYSKLLRLWEKEKE